MVDASSRQRGSLDCLARSWADVGLKTIFDVVSILDRVGSLAQSRWPPHLLLGVFHHFLPPLPHYPPAESLVPVMRSLNRFYLCRESGVAKLHLQLGIWRWLDPRHRILTEMNVGAIVRAFLMHLQGSKSSTPRLDWFDFRLSASQIWPQLYYIPSPMQDPFYA